MSRPLYVLGTGGLAKEMALLFIAAADPDWHLDGYVAADAAEVGRRMPFGQVKGDDAWLLSSGIACGLIVGVGQPAIKQRIAERYLAHGDRFAFPNMVHPTAVVDRDTIRFGRGNMVTAGCIFTCDISVGDFNLFNLQTTVGHDVVIGSYLVANPSVNISGGVTIEDGVLVGTGAQILENRLIGAGATIGAGAVATKDVLPGVTVIGIPARPLGLPTS